MESAQKWKEHTASQEFAEAFKRVSEQYKKDNEMRSAKIEDFLIEQALAVGVVKKKKNTYRSKPKSLGQALSTVVKRLV